MKLTNKRLKFISATAYAVLLVGGYLFVQHALETKTEVSVETKEAPGKVEQRKPVEVFITINSNGQNVTYRKLMENTHSIIDLFNNLREENGFKYERTAYTYGTEIEEINGQTAPKGYKWAVFMTSTASNVENLKKNINLPDEVTLITESTIDNKTDVTFYIGDLKLVEDAVYEVELVKIPVEN